MKEKFILAIDQGTTSSRAIIFDAAQQIVASAHRETTQHYPQSGWVEQDAEEIWRSIVHVCRSAIENAGIATAQIAGIGITNQRETVLVWDRRTGEPIHHAIVWQDRRTVGVCAELKASGAEPDVQARTGLLLDPYFSATKVGWLLNNVDGARERAESGGLAFGTIDSFLIWKLTGGKHHKTDATNASRTLLFNIVENGWDGELCRLFGVPRAMLPDVEDCAADFGTTEPHLFGAPIPILGVAGDQQAALMGQACFAPGSIKSTYGTGCFLVLNTGNQRVLSNHRLLTTIGYRLNGTTTYALEGSIFVAGAAVQWLRDGLGLIENADQSGELAAKADPSQNVVVVPAFAGLGAPNWEPEARGAVFGLNRNSGVAELARATLESACFQTLDLLGAMVNDYRFDVAINGLRVDGGLASSDWTMQFLADLLGCNVDRPDTVETTALGAAWLAGMKSGFWPGRDEFANSWRLGKRFGPIENFSDPIDRYRRWAHAVRATLFFSNTAGGADERGGAL